MGNANRVLITGASAGFGFDAVNALAARGHTVFASMRDASGRNAEKAKALEANAASAAGAVHVLELDVTDDASVDAAVTAAVEMGGIDVVINNAGIGTWGIDEGYTVGQAQRIFDVNLFGVMRVNRAVLPYLREAGRGVIVYVSSGLGRIIFPFTGIYTASKFALEGFAEGTSYELAPLGIESVIVQPGAYGTTFLANSMRPKIEVAGRYGPTADMFEAFSSGFEERAKAGGLGDPAEVVQVLVEEVERELGSRPLRRPIGEDVSGSVAAINETCEQVQNQLLAAFGLE